MRSILCLFLALAPSVVYAQAPPQKDERTKLDTTAGTNVCKWASREFSHGAQLCLSPVYVQRCENGVWQGYATGGTACNGSTLDGK